MNRSVAVIGGSGFIGRVIVDALVAAGYRVVNFDLVPPSRPSNAEFHQFDMTSAIENKTIFAGYGAVVIAAGALAKACRERPEVSWRLNVDSTLRLINQLAASRLPPRIVFLSSGMVYDHSQPAPLSESASTKLTCLYTASKLAAENCLAAATFANRIDALVLRPFTVYGLDGIAGDRGHLFGRWLELGKNGRPLSVHGDGSQVVDPVAVERIGEACVAHLASLPLRRLSTVNVTSGGFLTIVQLANLFVEAGLAPGIEFESSSNKVERRGWGDSTALKKLLGRTLDSDPRSAVVHFLRQVAAT